MESDSKDLYAWLFSFKALENQKRLMIANNQKSQLKLKYKILLIERVDLEIHSFKYILVAFYFGSYGNIQSLLVDARRSLEK